MGIFDELLQTALGSQAREPATQSRDLVAGLLEMLEQPDSGGVDGLARLFEQQGLGSEAASWIGTGSNRGLSPEQLLRALGDARVESLSRRAGLGKLAGAAALAALLPVLIDKLTPDGRAPQAGGLAERGRSILESLGGLFGGRPAQAAPPPPGRQADFSNVSSGASSTAAPPARDFQPASHAEPRDELYTVVAGDSLSRIAKRYYGDANRWTVIYEANRDQIRDPDLIHPGQRLRIPSRHSTA